MPIAIIDYGVGNQGSVKRMLDRIGIDSIITNDIKSLETADKLILPGVGAFDTAMDCLRRTGLIPVLNHCVLEKKIPILGICLGMQMMTKQSEEGQLPGLGWIDATTLRFNQTSQPIKIPHMGWNVAKPIKDSPLFNSKEQEQRFYFVHSYHVVCNSQADILTLTTHGKDFVSAYLRENIIGVQFHPEKSHHFGYNLLKRFSEMMFLHQAYQ